MLNAGIIVEAGPKQLLFINLIFLRLCINTLLVRSGYQLSSGDVNTYGPIGLLERALCLVHSEALTNRMVRIARGTAEASFQATLFAAFTSIVPSTHVCIFEPNAEANDNLDILITESKTDSGLHPVACFELKVGKLTPAELKGPILEAQRYAAHFGSPIYLINFYLEGTGPPKEPEEIPENIILVHIRRCRTKVCIPSYLGMVDLAVYMQLHICKYMRHTPYI